MKIKATEIIKNNSIPNLCLLYGSEDYLKIQFRDNILSALMPNKDGMNYTSFINKSKRADESHSFVTEIISIANTAPFFSDKRVIYCENTGFFKNKFEEIATLLKNLPEFTYMVFMESEVAKNTSTYKIVNSNGFIEEYVMPEISDLKAWAKGRITKASLNIDNNALNEFVTATSLNMSYMNNELEKLISYCLGKESITLEDINTICIQNYEEEIFNIINAIASKNKALAMREYSILYKLNTKPRSILYLLTKRFSLILNISLALEANMNPEEIAANLGIYNKYALGKNIDAANSFSKESLYKILELSKDYSLKLNTGLLSEQTGIEMFIIKCLEA